MGFSLARAAGEPRWARIAVAERERAVVDWHRAGPLGAFSEGALEDPRVSVVEGDLVAYVRNADVTYDALCLDIDNGPDWTVTEGNGACTVRRVSRPAGSGSNPAAYWRYGRPSRPPRSTTH